MMIAPGRSMHANPGSLSFRVGAVGCAQHACVVLIQQIGADDKMAACRQRLVAVNLGAGKLLTLTSFFYSFYLDL